MVVLMTRALGLEPLSPRHRDLQKAQAASAVSLPEYSWQFQSGMPVIKWDATFDRWLDRRIALAEKYAAAGYSLRPWDVFRVLPAKAKRSEIFAWDQGSVPSCSMHGAAHAYQCMTLTSIALGAPLYYEAFNPIYPFYAARGGNLAGGLDLYTVAEWVNEKGLMPASLVGDDNLHVSRAKLSKMDDGVKWQAGIVLLEDDFDERIRRACRALCSVCFGAGHFYSRSKVDRRGVRVMDGRSYGGHAQAFTAWMEVDGEEYVYNLNSHGDIYRSENGEPENGAWVGTGTLGRYATDMERYGLPFIPFVEGELRRDSALVNDFELPRAAGAA